MTWVTCDLHIHTALSPCADRGMTPPAIAAMARQQGLAMIAICDHNAAGNAAAVQEAAGNDLCVMAGMEIMTSEEAHLVGLFPDADSASAAALIVQAALPEVNDHAQSFGEGQIMDAAGKVIGTEKKMVAAACTLSLAEAVGIIRRHGGLAIAAHLDRPSFSVLSQLGFMPEDVRFDAAEISPRGVKMGKVDELSSLGLPLIVSSDAHFIADVGEGYTEIEMEEPSFAALAAALRGGTARRRLYA